MKNFAKRVSALVLALVVGAAALCPAALAAASLPDLPKDECVVDDANILSDSTTQTIVDLNNQLQSSCNGAQISVLTVDYTGNYSTEDYATQAFNAWGIGSASENNGVLILLVMESPIYEDGDYYVTYGDGFRNTTLESQASALAQTMENDFAAYDYDGAVTTCANNVASTIASVYGVNLNNGSYDDGSYDDGPTTFGDIVLGIVILFMSLMVMLIIDVEQEMLKSDQKKIFYEALKELNEREKEILILRYGLSNNDELTQKDVADLLGISQSYISRLEKKIIKKLRSQLNYDEVK